MPNEIASPISPISPTTIRPEPVPAVFAIVIGINKYIHPECTDLTAARSDADAFEAFLVNQLRVPKGNIISLRDEEATRASILSAFTQLRDNINIKRDEAAIVIYYAGHGARVDKPPEWGDEWITLGGQIEMLCPSDMGVIKTNSDGEEYIVEGIPDRTISVLLNHLSSMKGDNITFILDCCCSAGISRSAAIEDDSDEGYVARCIPNPPRLSADCDQKIWNRGTRSAAVAQGFSGKYHASHVLLAACGREQSAYEDPKTKSGLFTKALLRILANSNLTDLTYTSLMHKLQLPKRVSRKQTPHCEGHNVNRRLFNRRAIGADPSFILAKQEEDGSITLQAGLAHGITAKSTFTTHASNLYPDMSHSNPDMGHLIAISVDAFSSVLQPIPGSQPSNLPRLFYCRVLVLAERKISVYSNDRKWLESIFPYEQQASLSVTISDTPEGADLEMIVEDGKVLLYRNDPIIITHIDRKFPHLLEMDNPYIIHGVVRAALNFTNHLTRTGDDMRNVWMELKKLKVEYSEDYDQILIPYGEDMLRDDPATVIVDETERLGMTIYNQTDVPLYPHLFYFDPSDLMIIEWYTPPFGAGTGKLTRVDAPLPAKSELTIGYGEGGVAPWQFLLRPGEKKDVGFFKLYLTTKATNLSNISQDSPFEGRTARYGKPLAADRPDAERWGAKMSTVIQVAPS